MTEEAFLPPSISLIYNFIMNKVSIIGFGRFAKVLIRLLQHDFEIIILTRDLKNKKDFILPKNCLITNNPAIAFASEVIIYAVPIGKFEQVIRSHEKFISKKHLIIDTLSVKLLPAQILKALCKRVGCRAILTHPMFGPDSSKDGFKSLPLVMSNLNAKKQELVFWKRLFVSKGLKVVLMSVQQHDRLAANSQGLTHFVGRLLEKMKFKSTEIDTQGAKKLHEVMEQTCNDSVELFRDLQQHNPHTMLMRENLIKASKKIIGELLPSRVESGVVTIGIQGGRGSFNELATEQFISVRKITNSKLKYLFTTKRVLVQLNRGQIDRGVFAIANSRGGLVDETLVELGKHGFAIVDKVVLSIEHHLMKLPKVPFSKIRQIMAHDQVFKQCRETLSKRHSKLKLIQGKGDMLDTAKAAEALAKGLIKPETAILGNKNLAKIFGLEIIERNLQDEHQNKTTFLVVKRV